MTHRLVLCGTVLFLAAIASVLAHAQYVVQNPTEVTVVDATNVFAQAMQMPQNEIPRNLLVDAQAIAIVPGMLRGAFVVGVQHGKGVLVYRDPGGAWQSPRMIDVTGASLGYQIGVQATDLVLVFRTPQSVQNLLRGTIKIGVDASAAAGPVGRQTSAGTDTRLAAEILSYSRARGAFVGVSIDGSAISLDPAAEAIYYQPPGSFPASAARLLQWIHAYTAPQPIVVPAAGSGQVVPAPGTGGWVAAGQRPGDADAARQQLDYSSRQLFADPIVTDDWKRYLALPPQVSTQQALQHYEDISRNPQYTALSSRSDFQQTLTALRRMNDVRTASNTGSSLPPPPR